MERDEASGVQKFQRGAEKSIVQCGRRSAKGQRYKERDRVVMTLGNLAIIPQKLNSSISDSGWTGKLKGNYGRDGLKACAVGLFTMKNVINKTSWSEEHISRRARWLCKEAKRIWKKILIEQGVMLRPYLYSPVLLMILALSLTACGGNKESTNANGSDEDTIIESVYSEPEAPVSENEAEVAEASEAPDAGAGEEVVLQNGAGTAADSEANTFDTVTGAHFAIPDGFLIVQNDTPSAAGYSYEFRNEMEEVDFRFGEIPVGQLPFETAEAVIADDAQRLGDYYGTSPVRQDDKSFYMEADDGSGDCLFIYQLAHENVYYDVTVTAPAEKREQGALIADTIIQSISFSDKN